VPARKEHDAERHNALETERRHYDANSRVRSRTVQQHDRLKPIIHFHG